MTRKTYHHDFTAGPGGWLGWLAGGGGPRALNITPDGARTTRPWGVDYNHAPPGAGYLHLPYVLMTNDTRWEDLSGPRSFVRDGYSRDFTNARITLRTRGEMQMRGAEFLLLIQSDMGDVVPNFVLTGQPIPVTPDWTTTTLTLVPDESQWKCLGARTSGAHDDRYGESPVADALRDVSVDIILVMFPLDVQPAEPIEGDPHELRAGADYKVDESKLPDGWIDLAQVTIEYPD